ncbi:MAG: TrbG/VirB9 family P-type conjugative transfer protein [Burkholderia sp.]
MALSPAAWAVEQKSTSPYDTRIKSVVYNPIDTVELNSVVGISTHITVSPGEKYVTHAFGDPEGWTFAHVDNHFFVKPKDVDSDTNLTIVTSKGDTSRVYHILLHFIGDYTTKDADGKPVKHFIQTPWSMKQATVELTYTYPFERAQEANAKIEAARVQAALAAPEFAPGPKNFDYRMSDHPASRAIAPVNVWDNYRFTYFKFPANADLPTITYINSVGKETVPNTNILGPDHNIIAVQNVAKEWRIRMADKVIGLLNGEFDPSLGANPNGTIAPDVRRVPKTDDSNGGGQ